MDILLMSENIAKTQAFKLKGRLYTFTVLQVLSNDKELFQQQLVESVTKAPKLFENAPVVFDLSLMADQEFDLHALCQLARKQGMIPVAIQGGSHLHATLAQCSGLAVLNASKAQDRNLELACEPVATHIKSKLITSPVRSGQQIVGKSCDLIIASAVSHGAELLADGNIHVYGALRGRALAGISGDTSARIFCHSLEAELVSIAGFYRLSDAIEKVDGPCQIYLSNEHIVIESI